jgi:uncharacterized membrane protein (UPF0127 family)
VRDEIVMSGWIVCDTRVVYSVNIAETHHDKRVGMKAYTDASIPLAIEGCRWVHTFGMKFPIDIAFLDAGNRIMAIHSMKPNRLGRPVRGAMRVIETQPGAFRRWNLEVGTVIEIRRANVSTQTGDGE